MAGVPLHGDEGRRPAVGAGYVPRAEAFALNPPGPGDEALELLYPLALCGVHEGELGLGLLAPAGSGAGHGAPSAASLAASRRR